ncbi:hypothetical protein GALMADRAFT_282729 [Galerina marginata CBS 339.88]|uniref:Uncharacterized protein n=1 Tax=Galerina marginata (strain CBS 339.88) TaxID=685588 RepID=A0A067SR69_GALM3|nr:hypothetical protein GALMADRAFT_282729 [Galerina marginata CBS 339.88]
MSDDASPLILSTTHPDTLEESQNILYPIQESPTAMNEGVKKETPNLINSHNSRTHKVENSYNDHSTSITNNFYDTRRTGIFRRSESGAVPGSSNQKRRSLATGLAISPTSPNDRDTSHMRNGTESRNHSTETLTNECVCELVPVVRAAVKLPKSIGAHIQAFMLSNFFESVTTIALWMPSQGLTRDRKPRRNIGLGDVGYFDKDGGFEILFNIYLTPIENRTHNYDPPTNFVEYAPPPEEESKYVSIRKGDYRTVFGDFRSVDPPRNFKEETLYSFKSPASKGRLQASVLALPHGVWKAVLSVKAISSMESYFTHNAPGWYSYYSSNAHKSAKVLEGSLKLVVSCYQAKTWAAATFVKSPSPSLEQIYAKLLWPNRNVDVYRWERHDIVSTRTGPSDAELEDNKAIRETQCVAIDTLAIRIKKPGMHRALSASFRSVVESIPRVSIVSLSMQNRTLRQQ